MPSADDVLNAFVAIRYGEVERLRELLANHPDLVTWQLGAPGRSRDPLHVVTDWPGFFPNGPQIAQMLIQAGAEVDKRGPDGTGETALHWAASSDDAEVASVLIEAGADIEAPHGSIGTPLDNAVGYGCWNVARLLVARGARVERLWQATALGLGDRARQLLASVPAPSPSEINEALWHACAGGQRRAAELMLTHGADLAFTPDYGSGTLLDVATSHGTQRTNLIDWLRSLGLESSNSEDQTDVSSSDAFRSPTAD